MGSVCAMQHQLASTGRQRVCQKAWWHSRAVPCCLLGSEGGDESCEASCHLTLSSSPPSSVENESGNALEEENESSEALCRALSFSPSCGKGNESGEDPSFPKSQDPEILETALLLKFWAVQKENKTKDSPPGPALWEGVVWSPSSGKQSLLALGRPSQGCLFFQ